MSWVQGLPAVIFIRRLYGGLAGSELARRQYAGLWIQVHCFFPTFLPYRAFGSLTSNPTPVK
jgi:hypothetical protein